MMLQYIPKVLQFHSIPDCKYENCPTREEYKIELRRNQKTPPPYTEGPSVVRFNPTWLESSEELFAGDYIFGLFSGENEIQCCLYKWKRNNTRKITSYAMLQEWEWDSMVEGGVHIIKPVVKE